MNRDDRHSTDRFVSTKSNLHTNLVSKMQIFQQVVLQIGAFAKNVSVHNQKKMCINTRNSCLNRVVKFFFYWLKNHLYCTHYSKYLFERKNKKATWKQKKKKLYCQRSIHRHFFFLRGSVKIRLHKYGAPVPHFSIDYGCRKWN